MSKIISSVVLFLLFSAAVAAEFRGVWVSTVANIDFPSKPGISVEQMKTEIDGLLDAAKETGMNAVFLQVRPQGDAMYPSTIYPWSQFLTGKQGQAPADNFDPLKYWLDGAHKRNLQLHAWCNPYRVTYAPKVKREDLAPNNPAVLHPEWTFEKDGKIFLDPGIPAVRNLVIAGLMEIVEKYDIDGVHFDDYFYPGGNMSEDAETFKKYGQGFTDIGDWRRNNTELLVREIQSQIKKKKPNVQWGISPAGIWANKGQLPDGSATRGNSTYFSHFADTKKWVKEELLDYIIPQIYWHIGFDIADFKTLLDWWSDVAAETKVKLYIGMAAYRVDPQSKTEAWRSPDELIRQLDYLKTKKDVSGFVMFTMNSIKKEPVRSALKNYLRKNNRNKTAGS